MADDVTGAREEHLLERVRAGDVDAYQELYDDHVDGARQLARILVGRDGAEELVSESFARVLSALSGGAGPTENFRAYLHVTIRNGYRDSLRATREAPVSDQPWLLDEAAPTVEEMVDGLDESVATDALTTLPERWQQVLWHVEVEGRKPAEVAELMDLSPRTVSSLAHRAREGLKQAYLDLHAGPAPSAEECQWVHARMSKSARGDLSARAQRKLDQHLAECDDCAAVFLVVDSVNARLAAYVLPLVLLGAVSGSGKALAWLAAAAGGTAVAGGATGSSPAPSGSSASSSGSSSGAPVAAVVAAAAVLAVVAGGSWALAAHHGPSAGTPSTAGAHAAPVRHVDGAKPVSAPRVAPRTAASSAPVVAPATVPVALTTAAAPGVRRTPSAVPTSAPRPPVSATATAVPGAPGTTSASAPTPTTCGTAAQACTVLQSVIRARQSRTAWTVTGHIATHGGPARAITLRILFGRPVTIPAHGLSGAGWSCSVHAGDVGGSTARSIAGQLTPVTCTFSYTGTAPAPLVLQVQEQTPLRSTLPGRATMRSGSDTATQSFRS